MSKRLLRPPTERALFPPEPDPADMPTITVVKQCPRCKVTHELTVATTAYRAWKHDGVLIQDAFPQLDQADREILITGIDDACWKHLFQDPEGR